MRFIVYRSKVPLQRLSKVDRLSSGWRQPAAKPTVQESTFLETILELFAHYGSSCSPLEFAYSFRWPGTRQSPANHSSFTLEAWLDHDQAAP